MNWIKFPTNLIKKPAKFILNLKTVWIDGSVAVERIKSDSVDSPKRNRYFLEVPLLLMYRAAIKRLRREPEFFRKDPKIKNFVDLISNKTRLLRQPDVRILDIGCGLGGYGRVLYEQGICSRGNHYVGLEQTFEMTRLARSFLPEGKFISADATAIPFQKKSFDLVMANGVLHCLGADWQKGILEMARCSKRYILISRLPTTNDRSFSYKLIFKGKWGQTIAAQPMLVINQEELERCFLNLNLKILDQSTHQETIGIEGCANRMSPRQYLLEIM